MPSVTSPAIRLEEKKVTKKKLGELNQEQTKKSNVYIVDFSKKQNIDFEITKKIDLLNKADLKLQIQKFHTNEKWVFISTIFGNLSKNTLFSDMNRST